MCAEPARRFIRTYEDLDVFQRSMDALVRVHEATLSFPDYEKYDLGQQLRRAAKSVPANIAEGYAKKRSPKEFRSFLTNALGSATEIEVHRKIAQRLHYLDEATARALIAEYEIIGKQLYRLIEHWRRFDASRPTSHLSPPSGEEPDS